MKPAARLHIIKQREYRPACPNKNGGVRPGAQGPNQAGGAPGNLNPSWNAPPDYGEESSYTYGVGIGQPLENEAGYGENNGGTDYEYSSTSNSDQYGNYGGYGGGQQESYGDYNDYGNQGGSTGGSGACAVSRVIVLWNRAG